MIYGLAYLEAANWRLPTATGCRFGVRFAICVAVLGHTDGDRGAARDILTQFLLEAISISVAGCTIGVALGVGGALLLNHLTQTPVVITFASITLGFAVATAVRIFFGYYPAHQAARLRPIEALRYQ